MEEQKPEIKSDQLKNETVINKDKLPGIFYKDKFNRIWFLGFRTFNGTREQMLEALLDRVIAKKCGDLVHIIFGSV